MGYAKKIAVWAGGTTHHRRINSLPTEYLERARKHGYLTEAGNGSLIRLNLNEHQRFECDRVLERRAKKK